MGLTQYPGIFVESADADMDFYDYTATTTAGICLAANENRRSFSIHNSGTETVWIHKDSGYPTGGYPILSGKSLSGTRYKGVIYAKTLSSTSALSLLEMVAQ